MTMVDVDFCRRMDCKHLSYVDSNQYSFCVPCCDLIVCREKEYIESEKCTKCQTRKHVPLECPWLLEQTVEEP